MSRRRALGAGALALALMSSGCVAGTSGSTSGGQADDQPFEGEVKFWTINLKKNFGAYIDGLIAQYQKEHPKVTVKWVPGDDGDRAVKIILRGSAPPAPKKP